MIDTTNTTYDIIDRLIYVPVNTTTFGVVGDNSSRVITFRISRIVDGVDLSTKEAHICFKTSKGTGDSLSKNVRYSNSVLEFDWAVPSEVTTVAGTVEFYCEFRELDANNHRIYVLKTKTITQDVEKSFKVDGSATPADYSIEKSFLASNTSHLERLDLVDQELPFKVNDRTIEMNTKKVVAVLKDNLSQMLTFRIKRKVDGIDRADKTFVFKFTNAKGEPDFCLASNVAIYDDEIHIGWGLDSKVTKYPGEVTFGILVMGWLVDGEFYCWGTKEATFKVEGNLDITDSIVQPVQSWFNSWVLEADNILQQSAQYANQTRDYYNQIGTINTDIQDLVQEATDQANLAEGYADQAYNSVAELNGLYAIRGDKDTQSPNIFKLVSYYRADGSLFLTSTLNTVTNTYDQRTEIRYDVDGTTELNTSIYPISRDIDGVVLGQFGHLGQLQYHGLL